MLTAYAPVTAPGWIIFVELPSGEAYAPLFESIRRSGLLLLLGLALAVLSGMFLARRMVVPIQALRAGRRAHRLGRPRPAHLDQDRRRARRRLPTSSTTWPASSRNPTPTWRRRSRTAPASSPSRWSSRPRPPKCCRSSPARRATLQPVFDTMLENAVRICDAKFGDAVPLRGRRIPARRRCITRRPPWPKSTNATRSFLARPSNLYRAPRDQAGHSDCRYSGASRTGRVDRPVRRRAHVARRADAEGERADRRHRASTVRKFGRSPTSRSNWSRISPTRRSSPSRTSACSTNCAPAPPSWRNRSKNCARSARSARRSTASLDLDDVLERDRHQGGAALRHRRRRDLRFRRGARANSACAPPTAWTRSLIAAIRERHIRIGDAGVGQAAAQRVPVQIADVRSEPASEVLDVVVRAGFRAC